MPQLRTIQLDDGIDPASIGLVEMPDGSYIHEDNARYTRHDGWVRADDAVSCQHCGEAICSVDHEDEHLTDIEDADSYWCSECLHNNAYEEDGLWYSSADTHIHEYHRGGRCIDPADEFSPFRIGFEVEKEDAAVRRATKRTHPPHGWVMERDSSLDRASGFELVTRAYNLRSWSTLKSDAESADWLLKAKFSRACGGHIHISDMRFTPKEFYKRIMPIFPLFMALFPKRLGGQYSRGVKADRIGSDKQAFRLTANTIELRCPSAVRSAKNLLWRAEVCKLFMLGSKNAPLTMDWLKSQLSEGGRLRQLLIEAYCGKSGVSNKDGMKKVLRVIRMTALFATWFTTDSQPSDVVKKYLSGHFDRSEKPTDDEFADDHGHLAAQASDVSKHNLQQIERAVRIRTGSPSGMLSFIER